MQIDMFQAQSQLDLFFDAAQGEVMDAQGVAEETLEDKVKRLNEDPDLEDFSFRLWTPKYGGTEPLRLYISFKLKLNGGKNWNGGLGWKGYFDLKKKRMDAGEWAGALTRNTYESRIEALAERLEAELQDY